MIVYVKRKWELLPSVDHEEVQEEEDVEDLSLFFLL